MINQFGSYMLNRKEPFLLQYTAPLNLYKYD